MAVETLTFTKDWTDPADFPAVEPSEMQARADLQELHNQTKAKLNELITDHNNTIPGSLTTNDIDTATPD